MYTLAAVCLAEKAVAITTHYLNITHREKVTYKKQKQNNYNKNYKK